MHGGLPGLTSKLKFLVREEIWFIIKSAKHGREEHANDKVAHPGECLAAIREQPINAENKGTVS
jgi:hypothetical protein